MKLKQVLLILNILLSIVQVLSFTATSGKESMLLFITTICLLYSIGFQFLPVKRYVSVGLLIYIILQYICTIDVLLS